MWHDIHLHACVHTCVHPCVCICTTLEQMAQDELDRRLLFEVERGDVAAVASLLAAGACAEARDMSRSAAGESALHTASLGGRDVIAAMLLDARACVDSVDGFGDTALICAASQGTMFILRHRRPTHVHFMSTHEHYLLTH